LNRPDKALVLCCDEKSQCPALERTQPGLPLGIGHIRTHTHDYKRHGTITLFAAWNYMEGKILSRTEPRHTPAEWLGFLKQIDRETLPGVATAADGGPLRDAQHEEVGKWLQWHPRIVLHFTPTGSSGMNLVGRFFADLTGDCVREGSFASVRELVAAIDEFLAVRK
jgi:hypothetical protein